MASMDMQTRRKGDRGREGLCAYLECGDREG
jgi:hypothetical protein